MDLRFLDPNGQPTREAFNERFEFLNSLTPRIDSISSEYVWERIKVLSEAVPAGYTLGAIQTNVNVFEVTTNNTTVVWHYSDSVNVDNFGAVSLGPSTRQTVAIKSIETVSKQLAGKFIKIDSGVNSLDVNNIYYVPADAVVSYVTASGKYIGRVSKFQVVNGYGYQEAVTEVAYLNSPNPNAYPPAVSDGFTYKLLGQLGDKTKVETGSYFGTNVGGSNQPHTSLTFSFAPKFILIFPTSDTYSSSGLCGGILVPDSGMYITLSTIGHVWSNNTYICYINGNTVSWYYNNATNNQNTCVNQLNFSVSGNTSIYYNYVAIG